jgi:hypothetical protein
MALHLQAGEILSDITPFWAAHVKESLVQFGLHVYALHGEKCVDGAPLHLCCQEPFHVHGHLIGETLSEETLGNNILMIPSFAVQLFSIGDVTQVIWDGAHVRAVKVILTTSKNHHSPEAESKNSPVCTFGIKV